MANIPSIPPLAALRAFEAVARLGSFARAAEALHVTTSAVSHQISALERSLGATLIDRHAPGGRIAPTATGAELLARVEVALGELGRVCAEIRGRGGRLRQVTVSASVSIAALWLAPRLARFSALHPKVEIIAVTRDDVPNLERAGIDLAVLRVPLHQVVAEDRELFQEMAFPVCSPALLAGEPSLAEPAGLRRVRLFEEEHGSSPELNWQGWFDRLGLGPVPDGAIVRFSRFAQAIGAAAAGAGVALGRVPLIDFELESGRLVRPFGALEQAGSCRLVMRLRAGVERDPTVQALATFLREQGRSGV